MDGRSRRIAMAAGLSLAIAAPLGCRTPAPPSPTPTPVVKRPPPPAPDPCAGNCIALAEALLSRDAVKGLRRLRACLACPQTTPSAYARAADVEQRRGASAHALTTLRAGTREHPRAALLWQLRGRLALALGETREGLDALSHARRLRPDDPLLANEVAQAQRRHGDREVRARQTIEPLLTEASARFDAGAHDDALSALRDALPSAAEAPTTRGEIRRRLALVLIAKGDLEGARVTLERGLLDATRPGATRAALLLTHSDVLLSLGEPETALVSASVAVEMTPQDPLTHANVAIAQAELDDLDAAVNALRRSIDRGLPQRLTRAELLAIEALSKLEGREDFAALLREGWGN